MSCKEFWFLNPLAIFVCVCALVCTCIFNYLKFLVSGNYVLKAEGKKIGLHLNPKYLKKCLVLHLLKMHFQGYYVCPSCIVAMLRSLLSFPKLKLCLLSSHSYYISGFM